MPGIYYMAQINCNIHDCSLTVYKYSLKNTVIKNNWIPIYVIDVPYSSSQLSGNTLFFTNTSYPSGSYFGIALKDLDYTDTLLPFWDGVSQGARNIACLEIYKDDIFTISTTEFTSVTGFTNTYTISMTLNNIDFLRRNVLSNEASSTYPNTGIIFQFCFFHTTDDHYLANNDNSIINQGFYYHVNTATVNQMPVSSGSKGLLISDNQIICSTDALSTTYNTAYENAIRELLGKSKIYDKADPNSGSGDSTGNGGNPPDDIGGNPHKKGETPTISALDSGLITLYNPTVAELQTLGQFLWSDSFDINSFKKLFNDPFDTLLGLSIIPIKPTVSGTHNIMFGNLDSGVSSNVVAKQWVSVDCGTLTLNETWNGALDYAPSTQVSLYLPFIGVRQLNVNDVMGSVLHLYYNFDVLTGTCIAEISINHSGQGNKDNGWGYNADMGSVYTFEGQCAVNIPLASQDFTNTIRAAIGAVGMVSGAAASFAAGHPALGTAALMMGTANAEIATHTPTIERSGHLSSSSALMSSLEPCLFVQRAHICKPSKYYALRGVPSQVYVSALSQATGYFEIADVQNIHASGASDSELQEIKQLLTQGVFVDSWN